MTIPEIDFYDYYNIPEFKIIKEIDLKGFKYTKKEYPNPKLGKQYRNPNVKPRSSQTVNIIIIIGLETTKDPCFDYAYPPRVVRIHLEERRIYVKKED